MQPIRVGRRRADVPRAADVNAETLSRSPVVGAAPFPVHSLPPPPLLQWSVYGVVDLWPWCSVECISQ